MLSDAARHAVPHALCAVVAERRSAEKLRRDQLRTRSLQRMPETTAQGMTGNPVSFWFAHLGVLPAAPGDRRIADVQHTDALDGFQRRRQLLRVQARRDALGQQRRLLRPAFRRTVRDQFRRSGTKHNPRILERDCSKREIAANALAAASQR